ncbi:MAG: hypothetical protein AAGF07_00235 [Patescibacteria group bacterium]
MIFTNSKKASSYSQKLASRASGKGFFARIFHKLTISKQYKDLNSIKSNRSPYYRPGLSKKSSFSKKNDNFKVFKPNNDHLIKDKVKNKIKLGSAKKFSFGYKNLNLVGRSTNIFDFRNIWKNLKFYVIKWGLLEYFNKILALLVIFSSFVGFAYISFFDRFFLVKSYAVSFEDKSYLNDKQVNSLIQNIRQSKTFGVLPSNSYWYINDYILTQQAKRFVPEIKSVDVVERNWPNKVSLKITTEPILITLGVVENTEKKYWRISQEGKVLTEDNLNLRENVVEVDRIISFDRSGMSLKDYPLEENTEQLNRFWFVAWLWGVFEELNISLSRTSLPSLLDTDVEIRTASGVRLLFDSTAMTSDNQLKRIKSVINTSIRNNSIEDKLETGQISYIDFRIPKRVFVCEVGKECADIN